MWSITMKKIGIVTVGVLSAVAIAFFIINSLSKSAKPFESAQPPALPNTPARIYGIIEPLGGEVYIAPPVPRTVQAIYVSEGSIVKKGQPICLLDCDIEKTELEIAKSKIKEIESKIAITKDEFSRKQELFKEKAIPELEYEQLRLQLEYEKTMLKTALAAYDQAKTQLERLLLKSPVDGGIYKLDIHNGELFTPQDYKKIIIGNRQKQVRMFVESFWRNRITINGKVIIKDSETTEPIGKGWITAILPYIGTRDFRTEDALERIDVKYQQVLVKATFSKDVPIGLLVQCELAQ